MKTKGEDLTTKMIVISDDGKDLDDELAKVMCSALCRRGEADVLAYVANLAPALMRARLSKGTLVDIAVYVTEGGGPGQAGRPNFRGLDLGCIDANCCNESFI